MLKPFDDVRFSQTLQRVKSQLRGGGRASSTDRLVALLEDRERSTRFPRRFLVRVREKVVVVKTEDIDWVEAADYYSSIHAGGQSYLLRETMNELERRLDPGTLLPRASIGDREPRSRARGASAVSRRLRARAERRHAREVEPASGATSSSACSRRSRDGIIADAARLASARPAGEGGGAG